jgi:UDP-glucose 4-epimerase
MGSKLKNYKYLIVGSNSFIGKNLHKQLSMIVNMDNIFCLSRTNGNNFNNFIQCDINNEIELKDKLIEFKFDIIFYLIANAIPGRSMKDYMGAYKVNVNGLKNFLENINLLEIKHFIYFSTSEIYGNKTFEANESDLADPISTYSLTKAMAENMINLYKNSYSLPITIVRPSLVYGSGQNERFFMSQAITKLKSNEVFNMTYGEQTRDFIHVEDVCECVLEIIQQKKLIGEVVNISSNVEIGIKELVLILKRIINSNSEINFGSIDYRNNEIMKYKIDNAKAKKSLNWIPKRNFEASLLKIVK